MTNIIDRRLNLNTLFIIYLYYTLQFSVIRYYTSQMITDTFALRNTHGVWYRPTALKRKCHHFGEIFITDCTGSCQYDNFQCSKMMTFLFKWNYCCWLHCHCTSSCRSASKVTPNKVSDTSCTCILRGPATDCYVNKTQQSIAKSCA